ncbi:MAG TPA: hypothetical protein VEH48_01055, partial [Candidatus Nitrosopolaris sp.]|nr:hypothetical protein [Candidatus Nitrosopolaris sp.]
LFVMLIAMSKGYVYLWIFIGSSVGSYLPVLFHQGFFSASSIIAGAVGAFAGIWIAVKTQDMF